MHHVPRLSLDVGVLDAQHEDAAVAPRVEPVEKGGTGAADVQIAGGRRGKPDARDHACNYATVAREASAVNVRLRDSVMADEVTSLPAMRKILLWTLVLGAAGTMGELFLIGHDESTAQFVPLVLLACGIVAGTLVLAAPGTGVLRILQLLMVLFLGSGIIGVSASLSGQHRVRARDASSLAGVELMSKTLTGATPVLAPGSMSLLGVIGLAATYRHPLLRHPTSDTRWG